MLERGKTSGAGGWRGLSHVFIFARSNIRSFPLSESLEQVILGEVKGLIRIGT